VLRRLAGHADLSGRPWIRARLVNRTSTSPGRRAFLRVRLEPDPERPDRWLARLAGGQGSHVLSALALADGLAVVPEEVEEVAPGTELEVIRLDQETQATTGARRLRRDAGASRAAGGGAASAEEPQATTGARRLRRDAGASRAAGGGAASAEETA
jgi:hypothetical protein